MTDEEKAEEILQTKGSMTFCAKGCGYTEKVKELITIGLAESKPKWHDLKENPKDVPDNDRDVLVLLWDCNDYYIGHYREEYDDMIKGNTYWHFNDFDIKEDKLDSILAWMELPKFKEK